MDASGDADGVAVGVANEGVRSLDLLERVRAGDGAGEGAGAGAGAGVDV